MSTKPQKSWFERNPRKSLVAVLCVLIIATLAVFEVLLKVAEEPSTVNVVEGGTTEVRRQIRLREIAPLRQSQVIPGPEKLRTSEGLEEKIYVVRTDKDGFILPSKIHEDPDISIVFLGGSTTASVYVDEEKRFPYLTGRLLEQRTGKLVNAYNSGVSGNHTLHSINLLINKIIPVQPNVVALMHNINDFATLYHEGTYWNDHPSRSLITLMKTRSNADPGWLRLLIALKDMTIPRLYSRLRSIVDIRALLGHPFVGHPHGDEWADSPYRKLDPKRFKDLFANNLRTFISVSRIWGIRPILITQFNRITTTGEVTPVIAGWHEALAGRGLTYEEWAAFYQEMNNVIRAVAGETGVLLIDLDQMVPKTAEYIFDHVHLNDKGSELVADHLARKLADL